MHNVIRVCMAAALAMLLQPAALLAADGPPSVAITFDDLPMADAPHVPTAAAIAANRRILSVLRRQRVPATGFVTQQNVDVFGGDGQRLVRNWIANGFDLGNHGATHADMNTMSIAEIRAEIDNGERTIRPLTEEFGRPLRFYRLAYNHLGDTESKRAAIGEELDRRGYLIAASTIDTSDYLFNRAFVHARGNNAVRNRIVRAYLEYSRVQIAYYQDLNRRVLGRTPPAIMLLHLNEINAAALEELFALFRAENFKFLTLSDAQSDQQYATPPAFVSRFGPMWGYRWAKERRVFVDGSKETEPPAWIGNLANQDILPARSSGTK